MAGGIEQAVERALRQTAAGGIVYQQHFVFVQTVCQQGVQTLGHRFGAAGTANAVRHGLRARPDQGVEIPILRRQHHGDAADAGIGGQGIQRMLQHRLAGQQRILLGALAAEAAAAAGGGNQNGVFHRVFAFRLPERAGTGLHGRFQAALPCGGR